MHTLQRFYFNSGLLKTGLPIAIHVHLTKNTPEDNRHVKQLLMEHKEQWVETGVLDMHMEGLGVCPSVSGFMPICLFAMIH